MKELSRSKTLVDSSSNLHTRTPSHLHFSMHTHTHTHTHTHNSVRLRTLFWNEEKREGGIEGREATVELLPSPSPSSSSFVGGNTLAYKLKDRPSTLNSRIN